MTDLNPQAKQMADESMVRNLDAQARAIWPQEVELIRRYTLPELSEKLTRAGFEIVRLNYFNFTGYFAWWLNFRFLKKRGFDVAKVRLFDRLIFPINYFVESRIMRAPFGQSLIAVGRLNR